MEGIIHFWESPFMVLSCVSRATCEQQVEKNGDIAKLLFSYDRINQVLILQMPSRSHEAAISAFGDLDTQKLARMNTGSSHLRNLHSSDVEISQRKKAPDRSWLPIRLPEGSSCQWPTLVCWKWGTQSLKLSLNVMQAGGWKHLGDTLGRSLQ
ncbi:hypothetical protein I7I50_10856 [Histoplasma capsulatum G186AR]|uniref:Uncharacterized protein n=1 Tax=Ajellomyces capsulatus TaxID=5037 RepID=A0A8H7Z7E4_AJECA|nr:hypothetical protein I7I52_02095 [Histoplasma capsulatum]QSS69539.1 hypothetical protein I7I50_10856 [Histoplasma capsulatum G186AR]